MGVEKSVSYTLTPISVKNETPETQGWRGASPAGRRLPVKYSTGWGCSFTLITGGNEALNWGKFKYYGILLV